MAENILSKTLDTARNSDFGQRGAMIESHICNYLNAIRDSDRGQRFAIRERAHSNALDAVGKSDGSHRFETKESVLTYTRDEKGGSIRHYSLGDNNIPLITIPLGNDRCGHRFLVEAIFDTFDNFF